MTISPAEARRRATLEVIEREIAWREAAASLTLGPPDPELAKAHLLDFAMTSRTLDVSNIRCAGG